MNDLHARLACVLRCLEGYGRCAGRMTRARYERLLSRQKRVLTNAAKALAEALAEVVEPQEFEEVGSV